MDAADQARLADSRDVLRDTLQQEALSNKPVLLFANKQDLPTAATAAEVAVALELSGFKGLRFNILPSVGKTPAGKPVDGRLREGVKWLVGSVDSVFSTLDVRVQSDALVARQEEERRKKERHERTRILREERQRKQQEEEERLAAEAPVVQNQLTNIPNQIESPGKALQHASVPPVAAQVEFSDLQRPDQSPDAQCDSPTPTALPGVSNPMRLPAALHPAPTHVAEEGTSARGGSGTGGAGGGAGACSTWLHAPPPQGS